MKDMRGRYRTWIGVEKNWTSENKMEKKFY
jgi:hypothetical protein